MEKESLDQYRSVHTVLYSTQRQNSIVRKLSCLPAFPGEGAASALPVLYVRAPTSRVLNPKCVPCTPCGRTARVRVRNTCGAWQDFGKYACATTMIQRKRIRPEKALHTKHA